MNIGIIGAGSVGTALARGWQQTGHEVTLGVREPGNAKAQQAGADTGAAVADIAQAAEADVVVLAVPWNAVEETLRAAGDLSGKVVVDCVNPIGPGMTLALGHNTSAGEWVAEHAPGARVVKCFNTVGANIMEQPRVGDRPAMMCLAGDEADARRTVGTLAADLGFEALDCGPLRNARLLEPMAMLWIWQAMNGSAGRDFAFGVVRR